MRFWGDDNRGEQIVEEVACRIVRTRIEADFTRISNIKSLLQSVSR